MDPDGKGGLVAEFAGKTLIQGEPDASSFPNGGIRATFEARGYTAWDVTSPAYLLENANGLTLCIPTAFVSWTGEALDKKTPVLRSMQALNTQAQRLLALFGKETTDFIAASAGPEQEYFLVDRNFFYARQDLLGAGRTLFGAASPKGQQFDDHYFGAIPERVLGLHARCRPPALQARHPGEDPPQRGRARPVRDRPGVRERQCRHRPPAAADVRAQATARKHGLECLFHEKPFAGLNGSGKHVNWSMGSAQAGNLLDPGDTPHENAQFLVICAAVVRMATPMVACCAPSSPAPRTITVLAPTRRRRQSSRSISATSSVMSSNSSRAVAPNRARRRARSTSVSMCCRPAQGRR